MSGVAPRDRAPYLCEVRPRVCTCAVVGKELSRHRSFDRAVATIVGYWSVYLAFFGDQVYWLEFSIVDTRDGKLLWRNGRRVKEETHA